MGYIQITFYIELLSTVSVKEMLYKQVIIIECLNIFVLYLYYITYSQCILKPRICQEKLDTARINFLLTNANLSDEDFEASLDQS